MKHDKQQDRETMKAVIYCRVSSPRQVEEGHGLESQGARCRDYAQRMGYEVLGSGPID